MLYLALLPVLIWLYLAQSRSGQNGEAQQYIDRAYGVFYTNLALNGEPFHFRHYHILRDVGTGKLNESSSLRSAGVPPAVFRRIFDCKNCRLDAARYEADFQEPACTITFDSPIY